MQKQLEKEIDRLYNKHADRPISVFDIGKLFDDAMKAFNNGLPLEEAVKAAIIKYGVEPKISY